MRLKFSLLVVALFVVLLFQGSVRPEQTRELESFVTPPYPRLARHARIQGDVVAILHVQPDGKVERVEIIDGAPLLKDYVEEAARQWAYSPSDNASEIRIQFRFTLSGDKTNSVPLTVVRGRLPNFFEIVCNPPEDLTLDVGPRKRKRSLN
jgi:TonB family protein